MLDRTHQNALPALPGVGYKAQHYASIIADPAPVGWLEIHAENYMGQGGRPLAQLRHLAERFPISVHGVGLSIGGEGRLDADHLARLRHLCDWLNPASFSEHLAWSTHEGAFLNDLLPLPYTDATLTRVADHIDELQEALGRRMLLENPSSYLAFAESTWEEPAFLSEVARRTGMSRAAARRCRSLSRGGDAVGRPPPDWPPACARQRSAACPRCCWAR